MVSLRYVSLLQTPKSNRKLKPAVSVSECFVLSSPLGFFGLPHFFSCDKRTNSRLPSVDQKGKHYGDAPEATAGLGVFFS